MHYATFLWAVNKQKQSSNMIFRCFCRAMCAGECLHYTQEVWRWRWISRSLFLPPHAAVKAISCSQTQSHVSEVHKVKYVSCLFRRPASVLLRQPPPRELWDYCSSLTDLWPPWKSDFIKSLIRLVIYTVFDECHRSRCVDLIAALICLFNGVVEWKVVTTRWSSKTWVMGPAGERWKGKMQSSGDVEELNKVFFTLYGGAEHAGK